MNLLKKIKIYIEQEPDYYGFATIIKEYSGFPRWIPLPAHYEHGWTDYINPANIDLGTNKRMMLVFNKRREEAWKKHSNIPVAVMGAPFVHHRRMNNIKKDENAKGTVAFPAHSATLIDVQFDIDEYCKKLKDLDPKYHPITICLHGLDIIKGKDIHFKKNGFSVVSAGTVDDKDFADKFYRILKKHKYSTSNKIGSYVFYSIEMAIPFLFLGDNPLYFNHGDPGHLEGCERSLEHINFNAYMESLFSSENDEITSEQMQFVLSELGVKDCLTGNALRKKLWKGFLKNDLWIYIKKMYQYIIRKIS